MSRLIVLDETGDSRVFWNANHPEEVKGARLTFEKAIKKGMEAWVVNKDGGKDKKITEFDPLAEEIICIPKPIPGPDAGSDDALGSDYASI